MRNQVIYVYTTIEIQKIILTICFVFFICAPVCLISFQKISSLIFKAATEIQCLIDTGCYITLSNNILLDSVESF